MNATAIEYEPCPSCNSAVQVRPKLLLINASDPSPKANQSMWRASCACEEFAVSDLKPELSNGSQFIQGLYCENCSIGYLPESIAKPAAPRYQPTPEGWRRVFSDGTFGPPLLRISDDLEAQIL